jgi:DNA-binding response OmpR family regulator
VRVLLIDDDARLAELLDGYLKPQGIALVHAGGGQAGLGALQSGGFDAVLLDVMMPGIDGLAVLRKLRDAGHRIPVIMLTARGDETDRVVGLELGADDYVAKPFSPRELVSRVHAVLRRRAAGGDGSADSNGAGERLEFGELAIDPVAREATLRSKPLPLAPREFDLLHYFATNPRRVFSREDLLDALWDLSFDGDAATVTVHIRRLREKIEPDPSSPQRIVTVRGAGYRFEP